MNFNTIILFPRPSVYDENTHFLDAFLKLGEKKRKTTWSFCLLIVENDSIMFGLNRIYVIVSKAVFCAQVG